ncbi:hypothetical protein FACS189434_13380 [Bacteroidia bacterium]|nr:hypothetical protein FACS189434_13380 [Bacteroidia bacterium]
MNNRRWAAILCFVFGTILCSNAQLRTLEARQDSVSASVYRNIYDYSQQKKFSRGLYRLFFRPPQDTASNNAVVGADLQSVPKPQGKYTNAEGKIIRNIVIMTKSPFDTADSAKFFSEKGISNVANYIHVNTHKFVIRNLLMFRKNDNFDSLKVQESERLLRSQRYIDRARIFARPVEGTDSVDVMVQERDEFSLIPDGDLSSSTFGIGLKEKNFIGLGHQAQVGYEWDYNGDVNNYRYEYNIPNILGTYINTDLVYRWKPADSSEVRRLSINRPFYSPLVRWAGGVDVLHQAERRGIYLPHSDTTVLQPLRYNVYDFWAAYAFKFKDRSRNLVFSARYYHIDYRKSPKPEYDAYHIYSREDLYLFGIGFSERSYRKDDYMFRFGWTEDVPVGQAYGITAGLQYRLGKYRPYTAARAAYGQYFKLGYWGYELQYGGFFDGKDIEQGVIKAELNYFTPLAEFGGWRFRQFITPQAIFGINRLPVERLTYNGSTVLKGTHKAQVIGQSRFYMPYNLWGFRFAPYLVYTVGVFGNDRGFSPKPYATMDIGILFRNDYLAFNSFEFSFAFFLYMSDKDYNSYKFNPYSARDFALRDFDIGKPEKVLFE